MLGVVAVIGAGSGGRCRECRRCWEFCMRATCSPVTAIANVRGCCHWTRKNYKSHHIFQLLPSSSTSTVMMTTATTVMTGTPNHNADPATHNADSPGHHLTPNAVVEAQYSRRLRERSPAPGIDDDNNNNPHPMTPPPQASMMMTTVTATPASTMVTANTGTTPNNGHYHHSQ